MEKFTAVFEQDGDWWIGYLEELPGANTQGLTLAEARENLKDAVKIINCGQRGSQAVIHVPSKHPKP
jgi:hypothetical protein